MFFLVILHIYCTQERVTQKDDTKVTVISLFRFSINFFFNITTYKLMTVDFIVIQPLPLVHNFLIGGFFIYDI